MVPPGQQAVPPPGPPGMGYQQPPGAYPGVIQPPPPPPKGPNTVKIIIGVLVALLVVIIGVGAYFLMRGKTYDINVSPPPGYKEASPEMLDQFKESMSEGSDDIEVDAVYLDNSMGNFIIVASMDMPLLIKDKPPSGDDPQEMEEWFYEYQDEWEEAFNSSFVGDVGMAGAVTTELYQVERLAVGDAVLHMTISVSALNTTMTMDTLWIMKGRSAFFIALMGESPSSQTIEALKESISFGD